MKAKLYAYITIGVLVFMPLSGVCQSKMKPQSEPQFSVDSKVATAYAKMISSQSTNEMRNEILTIPDGSYRVMQLLIILIKTNAYPNLRSDLSGLLFEQTLSAQGLNNSHLELLTHLYASTVKNPLPEKPRPRSFIDDQILQSRLLDLIASILDVELERSKLPNSKSALHRLKVLLDSAAVKNQGISGLREKIYASKLIIELLEFSLSSSLETDSEVGLHATSAMLDKPKIDNHVAIQESSQNSGSSKVIALNWIVIGVALLLGLFVLSLLFKRRSLKGSNDK